MFKCHEAPHTKDVPTVCVHCLSTVLSGLYHTIALSANNWLKCIYLTKTAFLLEMRWIFWDEVLETRWNAAEGNSCKIFWSFLSPSYHFPGSVLVQNIQRLCFSQLLLILQTIMSKLLGSPTASAWWFSPQDLKSSANASVKMDVIWRQNEIRTGFSVFLPLVYSSAGM